jgi:hypothetical protein
VWGPKDAIEAEYAQLPAEELKIALPSKLRDGLAAPSWTKCPGGPSSGVRDERKRLSPDIQVEKFPDTRPRVGTLEQQTG